MEVAHISPLPLGGEGWGDGVFNSVKLDTYLSNFPLNPHLWVMIRAGREGQGEGGMGKNLGNRYI
jgi:hypothetical protein